MVDQNLKIGLERMFLDLLIGSGFLDPTGRTSKPYIESFNRNLRKECLGWGKYSLKEITLLKQEADEYLEYYHAKRVHLAREVKIPKEILEKY